jgi:hypothetical protein
MTEKPPAPPALSLGHEFKRHPLGRDYCTKTHTHSPAVRGHGISIPADRRYCGQPRSAHRAEPPTKCGCEFIRATSPTQRSKVDQTNCKLHGGNVLAEPPTAESASRFDSPVSSLSLQILTGIEAAEPSRESVPLGAADVDAFEISFLALIRSVESNCFNAANAVIRGEESGYAADNDALADAFWEAVELRLREQARRIAQLEQITGKSVVEVARQYQAICNATDRKLEIAKEWGAEQQALCDAARRELADANQRAEQTRAGSPRLSDASKHAADCLCGCHTGDVTHTFNADCQRTLMDAAKLEGAQERDAWWTSRGHRDGKGGCFYGAPPTTITAALHQGKLEGVQAEREKAARMRALLVRCERALPTFTANVDPQRLARTLPGLAAWGELGREIRVELGILAPDEPKESNPKP